MSSLGFRGGTFVVKLGAALLARRSAQHNSFEPIARLDDLRAVAAGFRRYVSSSKCRAAARGKVSVGRQPSLMGCQLQQTGWLLDPALAATGCDTHANCSAEMVLEWVPAGIIVQSN